MKAVEAMKIASIGKLASPAWLNPLQHTAQHMFDVPHAMQKKRLTGRIVLNKALMNGPTTAKRTL